MMSAYNIIKKLKELGIVVSLNSTGSYRQLVSFTARDGNVVVGISNEAGILNKTPLKFTFKSPSDVQEAHFLFRFTKQVDIGDIHSKVYFTHNNPDGKNYNFFYVWSKYIERFELELIREIFES